MKTHDLKWTIITLTILVLLLFPLRVWAGVEMEGPSDSNVVKPPPQHTNSTEASSGDDDDDTPTIVVVIDPEEHPSYTTYAPKITALYSLNAMLANAGDPVYFLPSLDEFPTDLTRTASDLKDGNGGQHKFAIVYGGNFDTDVIYNRIENAGSDSAVIQTSKKVYSAEDSSRCLNLLGYDLLLSEESATITSNKMTGTIKAEYNYKKVGTGTLTAATCIMDLYKAIGQYQWDISFAYGIDSGFNINESPILQNISVLTTDDIKDGVDVSEVKTYVFATRTNPDLYWDLFIKDAISDGGMHTTTSKNYVGSETSVSKAFSKNSSITMADFCNLARAMMTLYGEPVITEIERNAALQLYGINLPKGNYDSDTYDSIMYLCAKGILDLNETNLDGLVTFADIEPLLLRISDTGSRLTIKDASNFSTVLSASGYTDANISLAADGVTYESYSADTAGWFDYLIEYKSGVTGWVVTKGKATTTVDEEVAKVTTGSSESDESSPPDLRELDVAQSVYLVDSASTLNPIPTDNYRFFGIVTYGNKSYYHFKLHSDIDNFGVAFDYMNGFYVRKAGDNFDIVVDASHKGGVYSLASGNFPLTRSSFSENNFLPDMIDSENLQLTSHKLASGNMIIAVTGPYDTIKRALGDTVDNDGGLDFKALLSNGRIVVGNSIPLRADGLVTAYAITSSASNNAAYVRIEFTVDKKSRITSTQFFQACLSSSNVSTSRAAGFFRATDNSLLVSYKYLKSVGLVTSYKKLEDEAGYIITLKEGSNNVTLFGSSSKNYIMVGDTIFGNISSETLYFEQGNDLFINYRACMGWASDYIVVPTSNAGVMAFNFQDLNSAGTTYGTVTNAETHKFEYTTESIHQLLENGNSSIGLLRMSYITNSYNPNSDATTQTVNASGFAMTGTYALSPYCIVMADDNGNDYLFVYHRNGVTTSDGKKHSITKSDDKKARKRFKTLTGVTLKEVKGIRLKMYTLHRSNVNNPTGFKYVATQYQGRGSGFTVTNNMGWLYEPHEFDNLNEAIDAYHNIYKKNSSGEKETRIDCVLPFVKDSHGNYYDVNINMCAAVEGDPLKRAGIMPKKYTTTTAPSQANKLVQLQDNYHTAEVALPDGEDIGTYVIYPAPVAMFGEMRGISSCSVKDVKNGALYYGTNKVSYTDGKVLIAGSECGITKNSNTVCAFYGNGQSSVYVIREDMTGLGAQIADIIEEAKLSFSNPQRVVDWDAFTFSRLVYNIDGWSTVTIIFALNILPRVAMFLFMILLVASLIKDWKPWQKFCNEHFDVYSFITLGHQNVQTVNTRRVLLISLVCLSIFFVIMDGQLFNFIVWISRFIIELYQR